MPAEQASAWALEAQGISAGYGSSSRSPVVLRGIDLALAPGRTMGLVGESGSGKSTLAKILVGQLSPVRGRVLLGGRDLGQLSRRELLAARRTIQLIPQDPYASLDPRMTVGRALTEAIDPRGRTSALTSARVTELLETVALDGSAAARLPHEFSGGQRQRIAIARALAVEPSVIIADEIISALDASVQAEILNLLRALQADRHLAFVFVTHDLSIADYMCDEISVLYLGRVVEQGAVTLLQYPTHPYTRLLLDSVPDPYGHFLSREAAGGASEGADPARPPAGCSFHPRCERPGRSTDGLRTCGSDLPALDERPGFEGAQRSACHFPLSPVSATRSA